MNTPEQVIAHLRARLPWFQPSAAPMALTGGSLNRVWRAPGKPASLVVKHAPPYVASAPDLALDASRILFEAKALALFGEDGMLAGVAGDQARPPALLDIDAKRHTLVMEDLGELPDLAAAIVNHAPASALGEKLGQFIGALHLATHDDQTLARAFDNRAMQQTRNTVQYQPLGALCAKADLADAAAMGAQARALGERLLAPGCCLIMGDLWPPSVRVAGGALRILDWELCHYGNPAQDLGHLAAHLWMHAQRTGARRAHQCWLGFARGYRQRTAAVGHALLDRATLTDCRRHCGAEIVMRTLGPFRSGYLYDGLDTKSPAVQAALAAARECLLESPDWPVVGLTD